MNIPDYLHGQVQNILADEAYRASFLSKPSVMLGAKIFKDGDKWCCLYGTNIQEGVCGFGDTPDAASTEFDSAWYRRTP